MVYFVQVGESGPIKIGRTESRTLPGQATPERLSDLQTASPYELRPLLLVETSDDRALERSLHKRFEDDRIRGEWFEPSEALLDLIFGGLHALRELERTEAYESFQRVQTARRVERELKRAGLLPEPRRARKGKPRTTTAERQAAPLPLRYKLERTFG